MRLSTSKWPTVLETGRVLLLAGLAFAFDTPVALAFRHQEHSQISMAGLAIARACMENETCRSRPSGEDCGPLRLDPREQFALESLSGASGLRIENTTVSRSSDLNFTYGDVVHVVDYVLDPVALLSRKGAVEGLPRWPAEVDEYALVRLTRSQLSHASAAQVNDTHFQEKLMASWWHWHRDAVAAAARSRVVDEGEDPPPDALFGALMMNAISNHFLEDYFAPGHVTTPRTGLQDFPAVKMHDYYNRVGADFQIENGPALAALLDPEHDANRFSITVDRLREIRNLIARNGMVHLRGDGYLEPVLAGTPRRPGSDDFRDAAEEQVVLMTLVVARSIVDVFQSFTCQQVVNSTPDYDWWPLHRLASNEPASTVSGRSAKLRLASGGLDFGKYVERNERRLRYGLILPLEVSVQSTARKEREAVRGIASLFLFPTFLCDKCSPIPGTFVEGDFEPRAWTPTFGVGLHRRFDQELQGWGVFARGGILLQRLDLHLALGLGLERYRWDGAETWRFHPELRAGLGASFLNYILAVGYDHDLDPQRNLEGALVFRAGLTIALPWGKVADWAARH